MSEIKVSVIMPIYNAEAFLQETLASITGQTLKEMELICVDDGSMDNSASIVEEWMNKDNRISLLRQKNQYAGAARNRGLQQAKGDYVICWDADDLFDERALEVMARQAEKADADICICAAQRLDNEKKKIISTDAFLREKFLPEKEVFNKRDIPESFFNFTTNVPWNKLYKRSFIQKHNLQYQQIKQANDTYFTLTALYRAERITFVKDVLITYRMNNQKSLTGKASDTVFCNYDAWSYALEELENDPEFSLVKTSFLNHALSSFYYGLNTQTSFACYEMLYNKLKEEGFERFGLTSCEKSEFHEAWKYDDMQLILQLSAGDFLVWKSMQRRLSNESKNSTIKNLKEKKEKQIREIAKIKESRDYRLGKRILWLPRRIKNALKRG